MACLYRQYNIIYIYKKGNYNSRTGLEYISHKIEFNVIWLTVTIFYSRQCNLDRALNAALLLVGENDL